MNKNDLVYVVTWMAAYGSDEVKTYINIYSDEMDAIKFTGKLMSNRNCFGVKFQKITVK